jgi:transcriptional regulator with XRE-family HTH domain
MNYNFFVMKTFGDWLRDQRKALGLKQDDVAKRAGISVSYVSTLERNQPNTTTGKEIRPEPEIIEALAKAVQGDVSEALAFFRYAPREEVEATRARIVVSDKDGFDEADLQDISEYIAWKKAKKLKEGNE